MKCRNCRMFIFE